MSRRPRLTNVTCALLIARAASLQFKELVRSAAPDKDFSFGSDREVLMFIAFYCVVRADCAPAVPTYNNSRASLLSSGRKF